MLFTTRAVLLSKPMRCATTIVELQALAENLSKQMAHMKQAMGPPWFNGISLEPTIYLR